jgi:gamma-glutamyltranspeptidase/glutathione hydrolase
LLAATLRRIAASGDAGFYTGPTADMIVADMVEYGGLITHQCLLNYRPVWRTPVHGTYTQRNANNTLSANAFNIYSMPPPSSGGTLIVQILNTIQHAPIGQRTPTGTFAGRNYGFNSVETIHLMTEAMRYAFRDRGEYMADPDFASPDVTNFVAAMTSRDYGRRIFDRIMAQDGRAGPANPDPGFGFWQAGGAEEGGDHTTHYSVVDSLGNAVSITTTINFGYGNKMAVYGAGFLLNNEMDDLTAVPYQPNAFGVIQGRINSPEPGKRPLSSMSPTIVTRSADNSIFMVTGSPGGTRIITHTLHSIVNAIDHGMNISQAVGAPRFHLQWPTNNLERETFPESRWPALIEAKGLHYSRRRISR